jgi:hypothetical protein
MAFIPFDALSLAQGNPFDALSLAPGNPFDALPQAATVIHDPKRWAGHLRRLRQTACPDFELDALGS